MEPAAAALLPGVKKVVLNEDKDEIAQNHGAAEVEIFDQEPVARHPLPGIHARTRAFIKTQDGCNNFCTFCITRLARGLNRSMSVMEVLQDINHAVDGGVQEVVLSGVQLGSWGSEYEPPMTLGNLITKILEETSVARLRLSSIEPWNLDEAFFSLWKNPRLCRHFHLPLQSGATATLKRMARNTTPIEYRNLLNTIRSLIPDVAITTDILVGFPGKSEADFNESLAFVNEMHFAAGHVFPFSPRPGTAAARMDRQVHPTVRKERSRIMRQALEKSSEVYRQQFVGKELQVLWESADGLGPEGWRMHGLTDNYLRVTAHTNEIRWNQIDRVRLMDAASESMQGIILH